ncbi:U2 small nuclear ribonucleoprotein B [Lophiotrema nucula]|uniref:U2 small nuclear ribonucleoprotein B n=1 Tax=Lophiotrema nucula TaxID=690887 RepID=A0A6A5ZTB6_9PLEO|nr:U2 small nuclear ribonucleoprotein B [Lophiotrema nucula]
MVDKMEGVIGGVVNSADYSVPIETVYVSNLEERVKIEELKAALHAVFDHYGTILDIIAKISLKRKGQAFIVFDQQRSVLDAVEQMDGFEMYGKAMRVLIAKTPSDETVKRKAPGEFDEHKKRRTISKAQKEAALAKELQAKGPDSTATTATRARPVKTGAAAIPDEYVRPNKVLFLQNIPADVDADTLTAIFERFEGFKEVRLVKIRNVAFAEFEDEQFAITAKENTAGMAIGEEGKSMKVTYQRQ